MFQTYKSILAAFELINFAWRVVYLVARNFEIKLFTFIEMACSSCTFEIPVRSCSSRQESITKSFLYISREVMGLLK